MLVTLALAKTSVDLNIFLQILLGKSVLAIWLVLAVLRLELHDQMFKF